METIVNDTESKTIDKTPVSFNESEWLKLLFLLSDTQHWLDDMNNEMFRQLPICKKRFISKTYYLTATSLAHILERHYYKINRYPHAGKFHIPILEIVKLIRDAHSVPPTQNGNNFQRTIETKQIIGFDKNGQSTNIITILTDPGGKIMTAFPGSPLRNGVAFEVKSCFHDFQHPVSTSVKPYLYQTTQV